jgi:hypothetical protein
MHAILGGDFTQESGKATAPAGRNRKVLLAIDRVGHRRSHHTRLGVCGPQLIALGCRIRDQVPVGGALEHQVARCHDTPPLPGDL